MGPNFCSAVRSQPSDSAPMEGMEPRAGMEPSWRNPAGFCPMQCPGVTAAVLTCLTSSPPPLAQGNPGLSSRAALPLCPPCPSLPLPGWAGTASGARPSPPEEQGSVGSWGQGLPGALGGMKLFYLSIPADSWSTASTAGARIVSEFHLTPSTSPNSAHRTFPGSRKAPVSLPGDDLSVQDPRWG